MLSELARVVAVFVSLRSRQSDDQAEIRHLQNQDMPVSYTHLVIFFYGTVDAETGPKDRRTQLLLLVRKFG